MRAPNLGLFGTTLRNWKAPISDFAAKFGDVSSK